MSKRSNFASAWHITRILRESFRGLHKQAPITRKRKQGTPVMTQQYVKFVYKGQYYRRPIIKNKNQTSSSDQPPQLLRIPAQPLGVPKSFKEPPKSASTKIQSEKAALVANTSSSQKQQQHTWSWKSWLKLNTPLLILNFGSMATLLGFTRSDVLELRSLAMTGNCTFVIYSLISPPIKWPAILWSMLFASVNGFNIAKILNERQGKVVLTPHEMDIYQEHFQPYGVTQFQFHKCLSVGHVKVLPAGEIIARQGDKIDSVQLVVRGKTRANVGGRHLTAIGSKKGNRFRNVGGDAGAWIGEMSFLQAKWDKDHAAAKKKKAADKKKSGGGEDDGERSVQKKISGGGRNNNIDSTAGALITKSGSQDDSYIDSSTTAATMTTEQQPITRFISTIVAVEEVEVIEWSFDEMQKLLQVSNDMQGALTRAMTAAIVGKVVNFMVSRQAAIPQWSTMLDNWRAVGPLRTDRFVSDDGGGGDVEDEEEEEKDILAVYNATNKKRFGWR
eukprot:scaffold26688_cov129-Skeletonema_menzelii.AAC.3